MVFVYSVCIKNQNETKNCLILVFIFGNIVKIDWVEASIIFSIKCCHFCFRFTRFLGFVVIYKIYSNKKNHHLISNALQIYGKRKTFLMKHKKIRFYCNNEKC